VTARGAFAGRVGSAGAVAARAACLSLLLACGGRHPLRGADAGDADDARFAGGDTDAAADVAGATRDGTDAAADVTGPARDAVAEKEDTVDAPADMRGDATPGCPVDCSHLPHVRANTGVTCAGGSCVVPAGSCEAGFAHCSTNPNDGCEADLAGPGSCGSCALVCAGSTPSCVVQGSFHGCGHACAAPTPDACYQACVDFQSDPKNCGGCGQSCSLPFATAGCSHGQCTVARCFDVGHADCTPDPGCETELGTADHCAGCADRACALANTLVVCASADGCARAVCAPGFANCDGASPDCETSFASGGGCLPAYLGTAAVATQPLLPTTVAIGTDGSYFLAGAFEGTVDFDPTAAQDIRSTVPADDVDGFITKLNADGSYAWTRTFEGHGQMGVAGLAAAAGGAVVGVGVFFGSLDLDPGAGVDLHQTASQDIAVVKLAADGSFVWGGTFAATDSSAFDTATAVAVDAADAVYVGGYYRSTVDFDPGPATALRTAATFSVMIVKLTAAGDFSWVQSIDDGLCAATLRSVAVATDGAVWGVGGVDGQSGCTFGSPSAPQNTGKTLIASYGAAGDARGVWTLGDEVTSTSGSAVAAGDGGSVYVAGTGDGVVDLDPGPGVAARWIGTSGAGGGYIVKLGPGATFLWAASLPGTSGIRLAGTADGGVLGMSGLPQSIVTRLVPDGTPRWTFTVDGSSTTGSVAARGSSFALAGINSASSDFDPGPGVDVVPGDVLFLSRFAF